MNVLSKTTSMDMRTKKLSLVSRIKREAKNSLLFYILPLPGIASLIMFSYLPMAGLYIVFERYTFKGGLFGSEFVGLDNFKFFFSNIDYAIRATRNTLIINIFGILLGTIATVSLAVIINEINSKKYRQVTQSVMLFPHFISWIVVGMISVTFFSENGGILNQIIANLGFQPVSWYTDASLWWPILIITSLWKGAGYGSIIYFCALVGIDQSIYEAADIDGASRMQKILRISVPLLKPTIVIMFLLSIGHILSGSVDQIMGLTNLNGMLLETTDTIATFVYRTAILNGQFESASAITLYQSLFGFVLVMICNGLVKKFDSEYALF